MMQPSIFTVLAHRKLVKTTLSAISRSTVQLEGARPCTNSLRIAYEREGRHLPDFAVALTSNYACLPGHRRNYRERAASSWLLWQRPVRILERLPHVVRMSGACLNHNNIAQKFYLIFYNNKWAGTYALHTAHTSHNTKSFFAFRRNAMRGEREEKETLPLCFLIQ